MNSKLAHLARGYTDSNNPQSFASRLRAKRIGPLLRLIEATYVEHGYVSVIDIGGTIQYWNIVPAEYLDRYNVRITVANLNEERPRQEGRFEIIAADGCNLPCADSAFDIAHSNSVLEHVGDWEQMKAFAREVRRIAKRYYVQTPNFWFPLEPHFLTPFYHWLPKPTRIWLILHFTLGHVLKARTLDEAVMAVEGSRLLNLSMFRALFPEARIITERLCGLPKSLIAVVD